MNECDCRERTGVMCEECAREEMYRRGGVAETERQLRTDPPMTDARRKQVRKLFARVEELICENADLRAERDEWQERCRQFHNMARLRLAEQKGGRREAI